MLYANGIMNVLETSILAYAKNLADMCNAQLSTDIEVVYLDAFVEEEELPLKDVLGTLQLEFNADSHFIKGTFLIGISTLNDKGLFRLRNIASLLFDELKPEKEIPLLTPQGVRIEGCLKIMDGVSALGVEKGSSTRSSRFFGIPFHCTRTI